MLILGVTIAEYLIADSQKHIPEGSLLVNINTATDKEMESLPGIGPSLAERIIAGRPYRSINELDRVKGIGIRQVERLRQMVTVSEPTREWGPRGTREFLKEWAVYLGPLAFGLIGVGLLTIIYITVSASLRGRNLADRNTQIEKAFEEAERRRWEGHRRGQPADRRSSNSPEK